MACALLVIGSREDMRLRRRYYWHIWSSLPCCCLQTFDYESHSSITETESYGVLDGSSYTLLVMMFQWGRYLFRSEIGPAPFIYFSTNASHRLSHLQPLQFKEHQVLVCQRIKVIGCFEKVWSLDSSGLVILRSLDGHYGFSGQTSLSATMGHGWVVIVSSLGCRL